MNSLLSKIKPLLKSDRSLLALLGIGVFLRLDQYLRNFSLNVDEAWLAWDIRSRSILDILSVNIFASDLPVVPVGFAYIQKIFVCVFGSSEYVLRLFPLICGILSMILFLRLLRIVKQKTAWIALWFFVFCDPHIYYSSMFKQYSSELFIVLLLYIFFLKNRGKNLDHSYLKYYLLGSIAIFISHASIFVLAGIIVTQLLINFKENKWADMKKIIVVGMFWVLCFYIFHWKSITHMTGHEGIKQAANFSFMPHPIISMDTLKWTFDALLDAFKNPLGLSVKLLAFLIFLLGVIRAFCKDKIQSLVLILPLLFAFGACALHKYPIYQRFLIFALPSMLIFLSEGIMYFMNHQKKIMVYAGRVVLIIMFASSASQSLGHVIYPRKSLETREVMQYLGEHRKMGDSLYFNHSAQYTYIYYLAEKAGLYANEPIKKISDYVYVNGGDPFALGQDVFYRYNQLSYISGVDGYGETIFLRPDALDWFGSNRRTWVVFTEEKLQIKNFTLNLLDQMGKRVQAFERRGAAIYLYDLS